MNAIFAFLKQYFHVLLFLVLEIFCTICIIRYNSYQATFYFNGSRRISGKVSSLNNELYDYFGLYHKNEELVKENIALRRRLKENFLVEPRTSFVVNDTLYKQRYEYIPALVITNTTSNKDNYITINRGKSSGIDKNMGVFGPDGIIGEVVDASDNFAIVKSVLNSKTTVTPKIQELGYSRGKVRWVDISDPGYVYLEDINRYEPVKVGYHITTSPYSQFYPENIPIGIIESIEQPKNQTFYKIKVKLSTNFGNISTVYVVKNLFRNELVELEYNVIRMNNAKQGRK
ncbi:MAG: rod shape-determining protein MreC [Bacteroidia bacterium]|nr:rod shape-determining protein MreC [Bacteroidia bacterium]